MNCEIKIGFPKMVDIVIMVKRNEHPGQEVFDVGRGLGRFLQERLFSLQFRCTNFKTVNDPPFFYQLKVSCPIGDAERTAEFIQILCDEFQKQGKT